VLRVNATTRNTNAVNTVAIRIHRLSIPRIPCSARALLFSIVLGAIVSQMEAQTCGSNAQDAIATDRPQITSSSVVVPCGSLQLENGFQATGDGGQQSFDFPETSVRLGIAARTEVRVGVPDYFHNDDTASGFANGFTDLSLGFKQQLGPTWAGFDVSLIPSVSLPSGAKLVSSHGYDPAIQLPWTRSLTKTWTAAGMFSVMWPTEAERRNLTGQSSVYFDRQLRPPWDAYAEYSGAFPQRGGPQHVIDFGTAYKPSPHQQLDFHFGFGLSAAAPSHTIGFGYSVRFQVFRSR
jgi:Putative MetA-pathway of phenol degradation